MCRYTVSMAWYCWSATYTYDIIPISFIKCPYSLIYIIVSVLLRVYQDTGISFLSLWGCHGYNTDTNLIYRSGIIDRPFTTNCPYKVSTFVHCKLSDEHILTWGCMLWSILSRKRPLGDRQRALYHDFKKSKPSCEVDLIWYGWVYHGRKKSLVVVKSNLTAIRHWGTI